MQSSHLSICPFHLPVVNVSVALKTNLEMIKYVELLCPGMHALFKITYVAGIMESKYLAVCLI